MPPKKGKSKSTSSKAPKAKSTRGKKKGALVLPKAPIFDAEDSTSEALAEDSEQDEFQEDAEETDVFKHKKSRLQEISQTFEEEFEEAIRSGVSIYIYFNIYLINENVVMYLLF